MLRPSTPTSYIPAFIYTYIYIDTYTDIYNTGLRDHYYCQNGTAYIYFPQSFQKPNNKNKYQNNCLHPVLQNRKYSDIYKEKLIRTLSQTQKIPNYIFLEVKFEKKIIFILHFSFHGHNFQFPGKLKKKEK